jgi:hypothetical protein
VSVIIAAHNEALSIALARTDRPIWEMQEAVSKELSVHLFFCGLAKTIGLRGTFTSEAPSSLDSVWKRLQEHSEAIRGHSHSRIHFLIGVISGDPPPHHEVQDQRDDREE